MSEIVTAQNFILILLAAFTYYQYPKLLETNTKPINISPQDLRNTYDFIIIGAGSAGSVVANRLSENPKWNILLIEAGGYETELSDVPFLAPLMINSEQDWSFETEPQLNASCLGNV